MGRPSARCWRASALAVVVSIPLAAVLARFRPLENALYPLLVASQTIPKVAIAPLLVVWFGFGLLPKMLIVFLIASFRSWSTRWSAFARCRAR